MIDGLWVEAAQPASRISPAAFPRLHFHGERADDLPGRCNATCGAAGAEENRE